VHRALPPVRLELLVRKACVERGKGVGVFKRGAWGGREAEDTIPKTKSYEQRAQTTEKKVIQKMWKRETGRVGGGTHGTSRVRRASCHSFTTTPHVVPLDVFLALPSRSHRPLSSDWCCALIFALSFFSARRFKKETENQKNYG
jgi:hypothetical protein